VSDPKQFELPALDPETVRPTGPNPYPEPFHSLMGAAKRLALGDACGMEKLGVNLLVLEPNDQSSVRHWHTLEDEFVYVLEGELCVVTDSGEQLLTAGMCAGFRAGDRNAHHLVNRSDSSARYLEIGNRTEGDDCFYPDDDFMWVPTEDGWYGAHKDGRPYLK